MQSKITLREIASAASNFIYLRQVPRYYLNSRAYAITIALHANCLDQYGIIRVAAVVTQQLRWSIQIGNHDVDITIIIDVAKCYTPSHPLFHERSAELRCHFREGAIAVVLEEQLALAIVFQLGVNVAIGHK